MSLPGTLAIDELHAGYRRGEYTPRELLNQVLERIESAPEHHVWISRLTHAQVMAHVERLAGQSPDGLPLYGVPFAIKDNIDLAGLPTTAACPEYAYRPARSAYVVQRLIEAGAIPIGKTNLDQFATGLVGTRSPYGATRNSHDPQYIAGGSSAGSAVAVALGLVSFALGTDTAGSGRVPAAYNNLIGLKPTRGLLSARGVVPACRSLDCVSLFTLTAADAARVFDVATAYDKDDPYSRSLRPSIAGWPAAVRFGVPRGDDLEFFGDNDYARLYREAVRVLEALGHVAVEVDCEPLFAAARLLYEGPWIAERLAVIEPFLREHPQAVLPVTREIIETGRQASAVDTFKAQYRLQELKRASEATWENVEVLMLPTAGTVYRIAAVAADPIRLNSNLGRYTNFMNLLDLAGVAVPAGFRSDGLPFGITLVGQAGADHELLSLAAVLHRSQDLPLGAQLKRKSSSAPQVQTKDQPRIAVAVCGAHMEGLPLNPQLTSRGGRFISRMRTAPAYRLYALPGGPPHRPGLVRVAAGGAAVDLEIWDVPAAEFGSFVAGIPSPLGIGKIALENGELVSGFVCESVAVTDAVDITAFGGWRRYLQLATPSAGRL